jgi:hypothetical protein
MPRAKKPPAEVAPNSTTYGERKQLEQSMQQVPLADRMDNTRLHSHAVDQLAQMPAPPPGGVLNQPTARPNEPVTAGLPIGPGPGPEALQMPSRQQQMTQSQIATAAQITGNPVLIRMAREAQSRPKPRSIPSAYQR